MGLFNSLAVIFMLIVVGWASGRARLFTAEQVEGFEHFLFRFAIPCYLFTATITYDLNLLWNIQYSMAYLLLFAVIGLLVTGLHMLQYAGHTWGTVFWSRLLVKILAGAYVNTAGYALSVITILFTDPSAAILSNLLQALCLQPLFVLLLNCLKHRERSLLAKFLQTLMNPMVIFPLIGLGINYFEYAVPEVLVLTTRYFGDAVSSLSLFTFGLSISQLVVTRKQYDAWGLLAIKSLAHPLFAYVLGRYVFALKGYWLSTLVVTASAPTAVVVYLIAKRFTAEEQLTKTVVLFSSILSIVSLILMVYWGVV